MKNEILDKIRIGQVYQRKNGDKCLVKKIETFTNEDKTLDFQVHFHLNSKVGRPYTKKELLEEFNSNTLL